MPESFPILMSRNMRSGERTLGVRVFSDHLDVELAGAAIAQGLARRHLVIDDDRSHGDPAAGASAGPVCHSRSTGKCSVATQVEGSCGPEVSTARPPN